jgi:hypothetical protein
MARLGQCGVVDGWGWRAEARSGFGGGWQVLERGGDGVGNSSVDAAEAMHYVVVPETEP